jgi:hypothetical protein
MPRGHRTTAPAWHAAGDCRGRRSRPDRSRPWRRHGAYAAHSRRADRILAQGVHMRSTPTSRWRLHSLVAALTIATSVQAGAQPVVKGGNTPETAWSDAGDAYKRGDFRRYIFGGGLDAYPTLREQRRSPVLGAATNKRSSPGSCGGERFQVDRFRSCLSFISPLPRRRARPSHLRERSRTAGAFLR